MAKLRVELALSGKAHCAWCDTLIAKGSPRVARRFYHAEGNYSRDNGAVTGHNPTSPNPNPNHNPNPYLVGVE